MTDFATPIERLAWAMVSRRAVERRIIREGRTCAAQEADREHQCEYAAAAAHREHGADGYDDACDVARRYARLVEDLLGVLYPHAMEAS